MTKCEKSHCIASQLCKTASNACTCVHHFTYLSMSMVNVLHIGQVQEMRVCNLKRFLTGTCTLRSKKYDLDQS